MHLQEALDSFTERRIAGALMICVVPALQQTFVYQHHVWWPLLAVQIMLAEDALVILEKCGLY